MKGECYELTQTFRKEMTTTASVGPFEIQVIQSLDDAYCQLSRISFVSHLGTHLDSPRHYYKEGDDISKIPAERLFGRCFVVDCRGKGERGLITKEDVFQSGFDFQKGDFVFFCTGWQNYFSERDPRFFEGSSLSLELAQWLIDKEIGLVGIDTCTVDLAHSIRPAGFECPIHKMLLAKNILIAECLRLDEVAGKVLQVAALPMLIEDADGAPLRAIGIEI